METRFNKREVRKNLPARKPETGRPRSHRDAGDAGGANASNQRLNSQQVSVDTWNAGKNAKRGQKPHRGSGHVKRLDGRGAKPTSGALADHWRSPAPALPPIALLRGAEAEGQRLKAKWDGAEHRLLQDAAAHALGLPNAPTRDAIWKRARAIEKAGSVVAPLIAEAIGLK